MCTHTYIHVRVSQMVLRCKEPTSQCRRLKEMQAQSLDQEDPLEEDMATHSSILAWRIPRTEEPGRLQFIGSQRVGQGWSDLAHIHIHLWGFPAGTSGKEPTSAGDIRIAGSIPGSGRSPGEGNGNPLQHSHLGIPRREKPGRRLSTEWQRVGHDWSGWVGMHISEVYKVEWFSLMSKKMCAAAVGMNSSFHMARNWGWPRGNENDLWLRASKKMGTSFLQPEGMVLSQEPEWFEKTPNEHVINWHLDFCLVQPWAEDPAILCLDSWPTDLWSNKCLSVATVCNNVLLL